MTGFRAVGAGFSFYADGAVVIEDAGSLTIMAPVAALFEPCDDIDHHDHKPFWGRSMLLGAYIASGGNL